MIRDSVESSATAREGLKFGNTFWKQLYFGLLVFPTLCCNMKYCYGCRGFPLFIALFLCKTCLTLRMWEPTVIFKCAPLSFSYKSWLSVSTAILDIRCCPIHHRTNEIELTVLRSMKLDLALDFGQEPKKPLGQHADPEEQLWVLLNLLN